MSEPKYAYRLPPCPAYDIEGIESWLEDLAREGLILEKERRFFGFFTFTRTTPQAVRYRMEAAVKSQGILDPDPGQPRDEAVDISQDLGWEYVVNYNDFFIYRCADPGVPELHTDPEVQSLALGALKKRLRVTLLTEILFLALCFLLGRTGFLRYPLGMAVAMGTPIMLAVYAFSLWNLAAPLVYIRRLRKVQRKLLAGQPLDRKKNWRSHAWRSRILGLVPTVLGIAVILASFGSSLRSMANAVKLADYDQDPPFVTLQDLSPEGAYDLLWPENSTVEKWSDWLFPVNYSWYENAAVEMPDGSKLSGSLDVSWHEARTPELAQALAKELIRYAQSGKYFEDVKILSEGPVSVRAYNGYYGLNTVLLVYQNTVVEAQVLFQDTSTRELWIELMTERLLSGN